MNEKTENLLLQAQAYMEIVCGGDDYEIPDEVRTLIWGALYLVQAAHDCSFRPINYSETIANAQKLVKHSAA